MLEVGGRFMQNKALHKGRFITSKGESKQPTFHEITTPSTNKGICTLMWIANPHFPEVVEETRKENVGSGDHLCV